MNGIARSNDAHYSVTTKYLKINTYKRKRESNPIKREIIVNESLMQIVYAHPPKALGSYPMRYLHTK